MNKPLSEKTTALHNTRSLIHFLRLHAPFNQMEQYQLSYLIENSELAFYAEGDEITGPGNGKAEAMFIIKKGLVQGERQNIHEDSAHVAIKLGPGECFPVAALLGDRPTRTLHRAAEDSFCFIIPKHCFIHIFTESTAFRDFALRGISSLLDQANKQIKNQASERLNEGYSLDTTLSQFAKKNPVVCTPDTPLSAVIQQMDAHNIGSMVATNEQRSPVGIFTLRDLRKVIANGLTDFSIQLSQVMTPHPKTLPFTATAFDAALLMAKHHFAHVCLVNESDELVGVISERDIFSLQRVNLVHLARSLDNANSIEALNLIRQDIPGLINNMLAHGASVLQINRIITVLNDHTVRRVLALTNARYQSYLPDFTWLSFGSEARMEQTLVTDQDNGILFHTSGDHERDADRLALLDYAAEVNRQLAHCGFPLCKGNIMASNPDLCLTLDEWKSKFTRLVNTATPENLLNSTILFDVRAIWGTEEEMVELKKHLAETVAANTLFQKMLAANALQNRPPLNVFRGFVTRKSEHGKTIDLKTQGVSPFIEGIRVLALASRVKEVSTMNRLSRLVDLGEVDEKDAGAWREAYSFIQTLRMKHHYALISQGLSPTNALAPESLNALDERVLKEAFRQAQRLQQKLQIRYQL